VIEQILQADRHLQVDQVEKARNIYQRVVDMDPGNAIAVVGLARCALADGEDRQAYGLAARALEIDPENDMARRMEARLSEILASRGETVDRPRAAATPGPYEMRQVVTGTAPAPRPDVTPAATAAPTRSTPAATSNEVKERSVRKSLFDRLMGR
jgi:tetratricopeptide (TPR) repeat protein